MKRLYNRLSKCFLYIIQSIVGITALSLYTLNTVLGFVIILSFRILELIPFARWRFYCRSITEKLPIYWIECNQCIQQWTIPHVNWKVYFKSPIDVHALNPDKWYLLISNHQSWIDILVLQRVFNRKIPPLKFFMKNELLWKIPFVGWICWLLDFPMVRRYTNKQILKNPLLKKRNRTVARKACESYQKFPTSITNFVEGGRFYPHIQRQQNSPYQSLLRPRGGGVAVVLSVLEKHCYRLLNVTIIYNADKINLWHFVCGRIREISIYIEVLTIPSCLIGDYENDASFRTSIQQWLNKLWMQKDQLVRGELNKDEWAQWIE